MVAQVSDEFPDGRVQVGGLKEPMLLFEVQVTVPVALRLDTVAVHVTGELATTGLGEQET